MIWRTLLFLFLVAVTGAWCRLSPEIKGGSQAGVILALPTNIMNYTGQPGEPDPVEKERLPSDTEFAKMTYFTPTNDAAQRDLVHCSIVLSGAERKSIHRPEVCLQGQGWSLESSQVREIDMGRGHKLAVQDLCIEKKIHLPSSQEERRVRAHYVYWFVGKDVSTPSHVERIWLTLWDNITRNVNHRWAYPSFMALVTDNFTPAEIGERKRNDEETVAMIEKLIQKLAPQFQKDLMPKDTAPNAQAVASSPAP